MGLAMVVVVTEKYKGRRKESYRMKLKFLTTQVGDCISELILHN